MQKQIGSIKKSYLDWSHEGRAGLLIYLSGSVLILSVSLLFGQVFSVVGTLLIHSSSPAAQIIKVTFFGFIVSFLLVPLLVRILHGRPWWSVAMPVLSLDLKRWLVGFISVLLVMVTFNLIGYLSDPSSFHYNGFDASQWIPMLLLAMIAFFVQASTEEIVYRGYLAQFVHRVAGNPFFVILVPSVIFSLPHFGNIKDAAGIFAVLPYFIMGIMFGWLAFRSGSLWLGAGAHTANNWFITMFVGSSAENIQKISLFSTTSHSNSAAGLSLSSLVFCLSVILLAELFMRITRTSVQTS